MDRKNIFIVVVLTVTDVYATYFSSLKKDYYQIIKLKIFY